MELLGIPGFGRNADMDIDNEQVIQSFVTGAGTLQWQVTIYYENRDLNDIWQKWFLNLISISLCVITLCDFMMNSVRVQIPPNSSFYCKFEVWNCILFHMRLHIFAEAISIKWIACNFDGYISRGGNPHSVWLANKPVKLSSEIFVNLDKNNISKVQTIDKSLLNPRRALWSLQMIPLIIW